ncbi:hypothetical protein GGR50DRAFT_215313 [Xylaria sp. CBS 124048]|nr:hypothetical protein GGR50DRAFT_215313 [Xylaria sp. CBS 124048]
MMDDTDSESPRRPRPPTRNLPLRQAKIKRPARQTRATAAYFTSPSNTQASSENDSRPGQLARRSPRPKRKRRKPPTFPVSAKPANSTKRRRVLASDQQPHAPADTAPDSSSENVVIVPWHTLPYHVWLRVFDFVAAPIRDTASRYDDAPEAIYTLLSGARTCRATAEPALAALYKCPPFHRAYLKHPQASFAQFVRTLALPPSQSFIRYRPKVQILRIDVIGVLSRKLGQVQPESSLGQLLKYLPRLTCLELYHPKDSPPYEIVAPHCRWRLTKHDLLEALSSLPDEDPSIGDKTAPTVLRSWRWNAFLLPHKFRLDELIGIHSLPSFQGLRKLAIVHHWLPSQKNFSTRASSSQEALDSNARATATLATAISALPCLKHLVIESSTVVNASLLERLPKTLTHFELANCWQITSDDISVFLLSHGNSLTHLTFKHCQALSLNFLPVLGTSCPKLTHLQVDLSYYRGGSAIFIGNNKPEYESLLDADQVPTWPSSIQSIEMNPMRHLTRETAEMFFDSLMRNATALPNLRRLEFKVILNIDWRQRQEMRRSLVEQMTRIFKRKSPPPKELTSLRQHREMKSQDAHMQDAHIAKPPTPGRRRSSRFVNRPPTLASKKEEASSRSGRNLSKTAPTPRNLRSRDAGSKFDAKFDADDEDEDSDEDELSMGHTRKDRTKTAKAAGLQRSESIQGLCDIVDIQVDNQRPAERQFNMNDFIDSPEDSDAEWITDDLGDETVVF